MSGAALAACSGKTAERAFQKSAGNRGGGRTSFFIRSAHGGQRPCLSLRAAGAWRASARHSEQSGQILRYGLPQIKKISVFYGQGPVTSLASFGGEGQVRANSRPVAARARCPDSGSGEKRGGGEAGLSRRDGTGMRHWAVAQKAFALSGLRRKYHAGRGNFRPCAVPALHRVMSRADGALHIFNDSGSYRRL